MSDRTRCTLAQRESDLSHLRPTSGDFGPIVVVSGQTLLPKLAKFGQTAIESAGVLLSVGQISSISADLIPEFGQFGPGFD